MLTGSQEVIRESGSLAKTTEEVTAGMNEIASGVKQIPAAVNQVNDLSQSNRNSIEALSAEVEKFKV
jgi:methyl-accepting chemotaxis protein